MNPARYRVRICNKFRPGCTLRLAPLLEQIIDFRFLIFECESVRNEIRNHINSRTRNVNYLNYFAIFVSGQKVAVREASADHEILIRFDFGISSSDPITAT